MKLTNPQKKLLSEILEATMDENVQMLIVESTNKRLKKLVDLGFVVTNPDGPDDEGNIACRATQAGVDFIQDEETPEIAVDPVPVVETPVEEELQPELLIEMPQAPEPPEVVETPQPPETPQEPQAPATTGFALETGYEVPKSRRGGKRASKYPFDEMTPGTSFYVAPTEKVHNPAKTLGSTCSSASKRLRDAGITDRKFIVRQCEENDHGGIGARVFCVEAN